MLMKHTSYKRDNRKLYNISIPIKEMKNIIEIISESKIRYKTEIQEGGEKETEEDLESIKRFIEWLQKKEIRFRRKDE